MGSLRPWNVVPLVTLNCFAAAFALEQAARLELVASDATTRRADRIAARGMPPQRAEARIRLIVRQPGNLHQREGAGLGGEEKVGSHRLVAVSVASATDMATWIKLVNDICYRYANIRGVNVAGLAWTRRIGTAWSRAC